MKFWSPALFTAATILTVISIAVPCIQWASISTVLVYQCLAGMTAAALAICKLGFFPLALHHLKQKSYLPGLTLLTFATICMVINIDATRDWFKTENLNRTELLNLNRSETKLKTQQLNHIDTSIQNLNRAIVEDLENGYRQRALETQETLNQLFADRRQLINQTPTPETTTNGYGVPFMGIEGEMVAAITIHLGCVFAILACTVWGWMGETKVKRKPKPKTVNPKPTNGLDQDQLVLLNEIKTGIHGTQPGIKDIISKNIIKGGHKRIKPIFDELTACGSIEKVGRRYTLVES